jgi:hypothetical protein
MILHGGVEVGIARGDVVFGHRTSAQFGADITDRNFTSPRLQETAGVPFTDRSKTHDKYFNAHKTSFASSISR